MDLTAHEELARDLADRARAIAQRHFRSGGTVEQKDDRTPVTEADRAIETALRDRIASRFPDHGILGEELDSERLDAEWVWVLDPIDGTKAFATGRPTYGTLIGLLHRGRPVLGMIEAGTGERWLGARGRPTTHDGEPCRVRAGRPLDHASLYTTAPEMFPGRFAPRFEKLRESVQWIHYGADCYAYGLLALGHVDLVVERDLKPYDWAALVPIVEGAGGVIVDWQGSALGLGCAGEVMAATTPELAAAARRLLSG